MPPQQMHHGHGQAQGHAEQQQSLQQQQQQHASMYQVRGVNLRAAQHLLCAWGNS